MRGVSQVTARDVSGLASYKKALEQRNRLLKELRERPVRDRGLEAWDAQIAQYGAPVIGKRRFFIERLAPLADEIHRELTDGRESLDVRYLPNIPLPATEETGALAEAFLAAIENVKRD